MDRILLAAAESAGQPIEGAFTAAPHNDVLHLLVQIVLLLFLARILGEVAQRLGQSSVVGEILAGILLGPSFAGALFPFIEEWVVPQNDIQGYLLEVISLLGIIFLLLITGLETDLGLIRRQARSAVGVAIGGLSLTLSAGFVLGQLLPDDLLAAPDDRLVFALFLAISMAISAIPVIAKVLMDLKLTRRDVGQSIIASAMIDDTMGWILLSVVIGLAGGAAVTVGAVAQSIGSVLLFLAFSMTIGQWLVRESLVLVQNEIQSRDKILTLIVLWAFLWSTITHAMHLEALLGAFIMGILFSRLPGLDGSVVHRLESIALGIFAPIFFAVAGLKVDIVTLLEPRLLGITALITIIAMIFKVSGVYMGARLIGKRDHWSALFLASGLNARGSMGIIVATIGLQVGVLTQTTFSMIVLMAVITSLIAPAALRYTLNNIRQGEEEMERLRREELSKENIILNAHRVLLPVRPSEKGSAYSHINQVVEAHILDELAQSTELSVTLFTINQDDTASGVEFLDDISSLFQDATVSKRVVNSTDRSPGDLILDEAKKDYDLLVIGAPDQKPDRSAIFHPVIDYLMRLAPCPTMVIRGTEIDEDWRPRRILVPTGGTGAARRAAEVAFQLAIDEVIVLSVIENRHVEYFGNLDDTWENRQIMIASEIVTDLREMGKLYGKRTSSVVRRSTEASDAILHVADEENVDLIIIGTNVRAGSDRLYLGPTVERILASAPAPVMVLNTD